MNSSYWCNAKARHHRAFNVYGTYWGAIQEDNSAYSDDGRAVSYLTNETK